MITTSSSSSSMIIVRPLSRITAMGGMCTPLRARDGASPGMQGRRHGFESGGGAILRAGERSEQKIFDLFFTPHFLASGGGTKYCLDS